MFLCTLRLPSFRPRPCASRGSTNQNIAGSCQSVIRAAGQSPDGGHRGAPETRGSLSVRINVHSRMLIAASDDFHDPVVEGAVVFVCNVEAAEFFHQIAKILIT